MKQALLDTHARIRPYIHNTPVLQSTTINRMVGAKVYFKCENFQKMGAFKMRGATNAILQLSESQLEKGVITHSSGNHGQAVALAAQQVGTKAYIVMPENAPTVKREAVEGYGGIISTSGNRAIDRENLTDKLIEQYGATFIHPSNNLQVILGQGTAAMELLEEQPQLDAIFTPVGGGGMIAGTCLAAYHFGSGCEVYGGEPFEADDAFRSLQSGKIEVNETANTIADGLRTFLGDVNFPIIQEHIKAIIRVEESEIIEAMRLVWERMKIIIEPSCAVPLAALIKEKESFKGKEVGIIITGGNVDLGKLPF